MSGIMPDLDFLKYLALTASTDAKEREKARKAIQAERMELISTNYCLEQRITSLGIELHEMKIKHPQPKLWPDN